MSRPMPFPPNSILRRRASVAAMLMFVAACSGTTTPSADLPAPTSWSSSQVSLVLGTDGGAVMYQCGYGAISAGWTLSPNGQFDGTGLEYPGGGPASREGRPPHAAVYSGVVRGDTFTLTVVIPELNVVSGPFTLKRNGPPVADICV